ncbi:hypothetical protein [Corynebacterium sp.]|uniref:YqeB family protein n=1 Tax=Corynebacterium sp. TaxID=1720 RepID=UPI0025C5C746|nr:hypothetical protein [Corynebacterium sp.]
MSDTDDPTATTVGIPARYTAVFTAGGAVVGLVASFIVGPLVGWLLGLIGDAPGPLRLAAELPFVWAVPVLSLVGAVAGFLVAASWTEGAGTLEVADDGVTVRSKDADRFIPASSAARVIVESKELVVLDHGAAEVFRGPVEDEMLPGLRAALREHGYPELESVDPYTADFTTWVDGDGRLDGADEELLRARRRALADGRPGAAEEALDELRRRGLMVRDREGRQQYRRL